MHSGKSIYMEVDSIDWNGIWREQRRRHHEANQNSTDASFWDAKDAARRFYQTAQENSGERIEKTLRDLPLTGTSRVLDVGAGPGALALPIARQVDHVTAVEPSEGMRSVLEENIGAERIDNIDVVPKRWEDVSVADDLSPPYDIVFASYSLDVPDIRDAVRKLEEASSRYVYIYWFVGESSWDAMSRELWPLLHGSSYAPSPRCNVLYNVRTRWESIRTSRRSLSGTSTGLPTSTRRSTTSHRATPSRRRNRKRCSGSVWNVTSDPKGIQLSCPGTRPGEDSVGEEEFVAHPGTGLHGKGD